MPTVLLASRAQRQLDDLSESLRKQMYEALDELAEKGIGSVHVKKLQKPYSGYRKRSGEYRILFDIHDRTVYTVYSIVARKDAYKK
jgi:mRNA-degrading endonuclease RelE of RelBE toxin-antitoxin system